MKGAWLPCSSSVTTCSAGFSLCITAVAMMASVSSLRLSAPSADTVALLCVSTTAAAAPITPARSRSEASEGEPARKVAPASSAEEPPYMAASAASLGLEGASTTTWVGARARGAPPPPPPPPPPLNRLATARSKKPMVSALPHTSTCPSNAAPPLPPSSRPVPVAVGITSVKSSLPAAAGCVVCRGGACWGGGGGSE